MTMAKQSETKTVSLQELAVSNMLSIEAMMRLLVRKGVLPEREVLDELKKVRLEDEQVRKG